MAVLLSSRVVLLVAASACCLAASVSSAPLTDEERELLSAELRAWLEQNVPRRYDGGAIIGDIIQRRLRNSPATRAGGKEDGWNNIGMHNLFRLDRRSSPATRAGKGKEEGWNNIGMHNLFRLDKKSDTSDY